MGGNKREEGGLRFKGPLCVIGSAEFGNETVTVCRLGTPGCVMLHMHVDPGVQVIAISTGRATTDEELAAATSPTS